MLSPQFIDDLWYGQHPLSIMMVPLSWCYHFFMLLRFFAYKNHLLKSKNLSIPVIVIGNIVVGGTGKTPLVIWLAKYLQNIGYQPGIVSRGYKGKNIKQPQQVHAYSDPALVGDEPVLIAQRTDCPVAIARDRYAAATMLFEHQQANIIICDDGLQHYALERDIEIAVIDGKRRHGNARFLPAGPLREPVSRLQDVDIIVCHDGAMHGELDMQYTASKLYSLLGTQKMPLKAFTKKSIHAVAGIGNPKQFFSYLRKHGIEVIEHQFPDHYAFKAQDIAFADDLPVIMTEKDAVKCVSFASEKHWFLSLDVHLPSIFEEQLQSLLKTLNYG